MTDQVNDAARDAGSASCRDALRALLAEIGDRATLTDEEAMQLAYEELHAMRREHREHTESEP